MNALYDNSLVNPIQACRNITGLCSKGINYISYLKSSSELPVDQKHRLEDWQKAFQQLKDKANNVLISYHSEFYNPLSFNHLLQEGNLLNDRFTRYVKTLPNSTEQSNQIKIKESVPIGGHTLPPLPYIYNALEPYIDEKTMRLHHDRHHKAYVDGLNKAERMMEQARQTGDFELITHWEREAAFHGAGHYLHTIFWNNMSPKGGGQPSGHLQAQIHKDFGSFSAFKRHFSSAAEKAEAVGWALLVWSPRSRRLEILQAEKHQNLSQWDIIPLLVLDVWEHAYYLKYQNDRKSYIAAWWNIVNWDYVSKRFEKAHSLSWQPF